MSKGQVHSFLHTRRCEWASVLFIFVVYNRGSEKSTPYTPK